MNHVIAAGPPFYEGMAQELTRRTGHSFFQISRREDLRADWLKELAPRYVFFPHWSSLIPHEIFDAHECVIFHMTDLPYGRGGSPLQNLIARGFRETKISALRCIAELDAGPIYMKAPLSLDGRAEDIYIRAAGVISDMIEGLVTTQPVPTPQVGEVQRFPRRKPSEGNLAGIEEPGKIYDMIRMLDAPGYPRAFLEIGGLRLEFERAALRDDGVDANVRIEIKHS